MQTLLLLLGRCLGGEQLVKAARAIVVVLFVSNNFCEALKILHFVV